MLHYLHFAFPNLYLANGYREEQVDGGVTRSYEREDELEECIRLLVVRNPARLRGWDLRFLRRGLGMTQADFAKLVDRNEQTVARWEKRRASIPVYVDLTVRMHFLNRFEPGATVREVLAYVSRSAPPLPQRIVLTLTNEGWVSSLAQTVAVNATGDLVVQLTSSKELYSNVWRSIYYTNRIVGERIRMGNDSAAEINPREMKDLAAWNRLITPGTRFAAEVTQDQEPRITIQ